MPSNAVDELWHLLLEEFNDFYRQICLTHLGYVLKHQPHDPVSTASQRMDQQKQLANTWHGACHIHFLNPQMTKKLPRLFQIDAYIGWKDSLVFSLLFLISVYEQTKIILNNSDHSSSSGNTLCASSVTSCFSCVDSSNDSSSSSDCIDSDSSSCSSYSSSD